MIVTLFIRASDVTNENTEEAQEPHRPKRGNAATVIDRNQSTFPPCRTDSPTTMTLICAAECRS
ncbi:hypothetical protein [Escherichia coli]|uniref:hypothetical protein n=1 Tax=Escherichia coli TaxID=562 RepID=UPI00162A5E10|nr:hypothetical protein [Escherichia coli]